MDPLLSLQRTLSKAAQRAYRDAQDGYPYAQLLERFAAVVEQDARNIGMIRLAIAVVEGDEEPTFTRLDEED